MTRMTHENSMTKQSRFWSLTAMLGAGALALTACGGDGESDASSGGDGDLDEVSLMLNWYPYGEHAPFYYGVDEGIFEDHGIDLDIQAGQGSTRTVQAIGTGEADFGWADTAPLMSNIDQGVSVKSVGVFLQTTPSAVQFFSDSGIEEPADLEGKTIAVSAGDAPTSTFPQYLEEAGVDADAVNQQNLDPAGKVSAVISGQVDGLIGFAHDQGPQIEDESGDDVSYLRYSDVGLNFYSNGLLASQSTIDDDSDLVERMVAATSEAFDAAVEDPEAAAGAMEGEDPQLPAQSVVVEQWKQTSEILTTDNSEGEAPGWNAAEDWENTISVMAEAELIDEEKPVETYYDDSFAPEGE